MTMYMVIRALNNNDHTAVHYEAGYVVLSYFISLVGCITTLELLQRRTSSRGAYNWFLLTASSITMGGIGIWCMHFIGNRAIVLADGTDSAQLLYNRAYTALSFFLPIVVLFLAFYLLAIRSKPTDVHIFFAGLLTGTAVCAMHYVGQVGIANYNCSYSVANVVGAAIIAVVASLTALSIFFRLRERWTDSWWKRSLCAALLASAVSGMHWTAAVGTVYRPRRNGMMRGSSGRAQTVIFCAVLSIAACVFLLAIMLLARWRALIARRRAQELVLACAYFDDVGRIMVTRDGMLPYQKITNHFVRRTFNDDELDRSHPAFMWVYKASRNWTVLRELVPGMQTYLNADPVARRYQPDRPNSIDLSRTASAEFNMIFKQLFCVAAQRLANQIHEPMDKLGVLFEEPLETGTEGIQQGIRSLKDVRKLVRGLRAADLEAGSIIKVFGKGRYLFLNRRLSRSEAADFAALGYRFGSIPHVSENLARNMQVDHERMVSRLERMKLYSSREHLHPPGIHLACFLIRPNIATGFDVLVSNTNQNQLPYITLPIPKITPFHQAILQSFDELSVQEILKNSVVQDTSISQKEREFRWQLHSAFVRLVDLISDSETMMQARFSARQVQAPSQTLIGSKSQSTSLLLSVRFLGTIHSASRKEGLTYIPLHFFHTQQMVESAGQDDENFTKRAKAEFAQFIDNARNWNQDSNKTSGHGDVTFYDHSQRRKSRDSVWDRPRRYLSKSSRDSVKSVGPSPGSSTLGIATTEAISSICPQISEKPFTHILEEVHEMSRTETPSGPSSPVPPNDPITTEPNRREEVYKSVDAARKSDEIRMVVSPDINTDDNVAMLDEDANRTSFVSELFSLFRLSRSLPKGRVWKMNETTE